MKLDKKIELKRRNINYFLIIFLTVISYLNVIYFINQGNPIIVVILFGLWIYLFKETAINLQEYFSKQTIIEINYEGIKHNKKNYFIPILSIKTVQYVKSMKYIIIRYDLDIPKELKIQDQYDVPLEAVQDILTHYLNTMKRSVD